MTHGILKSLDFPAKYRNNEEFKKRYRSIGFFYERKTNNPPMVVVAEELEKFIHNNKTDPAEIEGHILRDFRHDFARGNGKAQFICFLQPHRTTNPILLKNYDLYEAFERV